MIVALALAAYGAEADVPVDRWCDLADLVAVAEVTSSETLWSEGPEGRLVTRWWLAVDHVVKGPKIDTIEVVLPGGTRDGLTLWVEDVPELGLDRTFVVVLNERRGAWVPAVGRGSALAVARHPRERLPSTAEVMGRLGCP